MSGRPGGPDDLPGGIGKRRPFDPAWCLVAAPDAAPDAVASQLCQADGVIGTRAVLEEARDHRVAPVLAAGVYEPAEVVHERLLASPPWTALAISPVLPPGHRVLDLRDGVLTREASGPDGALRSVRFACLDRPGTQVLVAEVSDALVEDADDVAGTGLELVRRSSSFGGGVAVALATTRRRLDDGTVAIERVAAHVTGARRAPGTAAAVRQLGAATSAGAAALLEEQRAHWARRWDLADVACDGDPDATRTLRACLFHLAGSARRRGEAAVGARGLTGPAYAGHVFWDTDAFVLPALAAVDPPAARATLEYRIRRLEPARRRARAEGRAGARFPWESALSGEDVTPLSGVDQHGQVIPITTGEEEIHISAIVAWGAWRYAAWHGGWRFLAGPGRPLVVDTARYWASRVRVDAQGRGHLDGVTGPDEYHDGVDDNAFTNLLARWNLHRAADLVARVGGDADEAVDWRRIGDALVDNYDPATGVHEQFAGYAALSPMMAADVGTPPVPADAVLGHDGVRATQIIKQADVLMAHYLIPDAMAQGSLVPDLEYYLPRTAHGSSLSPGIHAALLARAGRPDEALDLFRMAAAIDFEDLSGNEDGGLHLANLGGMWQAAVHGFAGVSVVGPEDPVLRVTPCLPAAWEELQVRLRWRGIPVRLACRKDAVHVASDVPMTVVVRGTPERVGPDGRWIG